MVNIAEVIYNGIAFDPKNWRNPPVENFESIPESVELLFDELARQKVTYTLVGGVALLNYIPGRNTQDVDFILSLKDAAKIPGLVIKDSDTQFALGEFQGLRVDLLLPGCKLFRLVQQKYRRMIQFEKRKVPTATVEGIVILKMFALPSRYRQFDYDKASIYENDIFQLMMRHQVDLRAMLKVLTPHITTNDQWALDQLIPELEGRAKRMRQS